MTAETQATTAIPRGAGGNAAPKLVRTGIRLRNIELGLLIPAVAIAGGSIALVQLGATGRLDFDILSLAIGPGVLVLALHIVLRIIARDADPFILPIATALNGLGIAEIYRIDIANSRVGWAANGVHQVVWTGVGIGLAILLLIVLRNHRVLQRYTYIAMFVSIVLLVLPLIPGLGHPGDAAKVWVYLGPSLSFQPGELAKITLAVFFAGYLVARRDSLAMAGPKILGLRLPRPRDLGPIIVVWLLALAVIVFEHDLGTGLLFFGMFVVMLYVATGRTSWIVIGLVMAGVGAYFASRSLSYVNGRIENWLDTFSQKVIDAPGGSYQLVTALFGLGNGGLFGSGLGQGRPYLVPEADSDFIFTSLGEELGLVGVFAILCLYLLFVSRGFRIGFAGPDDFGKLLAVGLAFVFGLQCFIVIGGALRVIPETGLTTPFLAAGGSSLIANWMIAAILLRLSDTIRRQPRLVI